MNIYIHIGRARSGSTSFQTGMASAREKLLLEGIVYPSSRLNDPRHMPMFWSAIKSRITELHPWHRQMFDGLSLDARIAATMEEAKGAETLIISNEWFSVALEETIYEDMVSKLSKYGKVTALAVLRDQGDVMVSAWARKIMDHEEVGPLEKMTGQVADWGKKTRPLSHLATVENWSKLCDMKIIRYSGNTASQLSRLCGVKTSLDFPRLSKSVPLELCDYLRVRKQENMGQARWSNLVEDVATNSEKYLQFSRPETVQIANDLKERVRLVYEPSNEAVYKRFSSFFVDSAGN